MTSGSIVKILLVSSFPPRHCGIGAYARDQAARLRAEGHAVTVLSPPDGAGDLRVPFLGGAVFRRAASIGGDFDRIVVHFQPALYYRPRAASSKVTTSASLLWLALRRSRALEILVHEADPPIRWRPDYALLRRAFRAAGTVTFHTEAERRALERDYGVRVRSAIAEHRVSPAPASSGVSRAEARRRLGIDEDPAGPVLVCLGFLQASKGFDRAVEAFDRAQPGGSLYLVGSVREDTPDNRAYARGLRARCEAVPGVRLIERFVPDDEFDLWVLAADRVVLPYRRSWSSGVLARAHALGTPAIVGAAGGLAEQARDGDVVVDGDEELMEALRDSVKRVAP